MLTAKDLRRPLPAGWSLLCGIDTGTYMSAVFTIFPPGTDTESFTVFECPNYRYVGGAPELLGLSIPEWSRLVTDEYRQYFPRATKLQAWLDENSQFKTELARYNIHGHGNKRKLELRVEISREYLSNRRAWLAPWLSVLPWELEHATWPDETSSAGRFEREKTNDHTLDCFEHIHSRRPHSKFAQRSKPETFLERHLRLNRRVDIGGGHDPHLGRL